MRYPIFLLYGRIGWAFCWKHKPFYFEPSMAELYINQDFSVYYLFFCCFHKFQRSQYRPFDFFVRTNLRILFNEKPVGISDDRIKMEYWPRKKWFNNPILCKASPFYPKCGHFKHILGWVFRFTGHMGNLLICKFIQGKTSWNHNLHLWNLLPVH